MNMYPMKFGPIFKERIWGGQKLRAYFGKDLPADVPIGESWELADVHEDKSIVVNGSLEGMDLAECLAKSPEEITGRSNYQPPFPLLIKLLDCQDVLSVQVHPDRETCERMGRGEPKTECWYIIDAEPGACIYKGLQAGTTRNQFAKAIEDGTCADYLERIEVKVGECHFLPSGTPHAIGKGLLIAEIQQPSDTTYRVFDWNRVDAQTGQGRELHIEEALESIHFDPSGDALTVHSQGRLVDADEFKVDKGHQAKVGEMLLPGGQMRVLVFLSGTGQIAWGVEDKVTRFGSGDTILVPAACESTIVFEQESEYLIATV